MVLSIAIGIVIGGIGMFACFWWLLTGKYNFEQRGKHKEFFKKGKGSFLITDRTNKTVADTV